MVYLVLDYSYFPSKATSTMAMAEDDYHTTDSMPFESKSLA